MKLKLVSKKSEVEGVCSFVLQADKKVSWIPGQYMHYDLPHDNMDERGEKRWFTISSAPFEGHMMITTRTDGGIRSSFKQALLALDEGSEIEADGPEGLFVLEPGQKHHVLIAGGIGITPFRSMLAQADHAQANLQATLLYANRDEHFVFMIELEEFAKRNPGLKINKYVADERISDEQLSQLINDTSTVFYVSGPKPMVENYYDKLLELGAPAERVKKDFFPGY